MRVKLKLKVKVQEPRVSPDSLGVISGLRRGRAVLGVGRDAQGGLAHFHRALADLELGEQVLSARRWES